MSKGRLRLKSEIVLRAPNPPVSDDCVAQVWVDSGVFHLDGVYSYLIPSDLDGEVVIGSSVLVPFNGRELSALVISRENLLGRANLKSISKVEGSLPIFSAAQIRLIALLAQRYLAPHFDFVRAFAPARVLSIDREFADYALIESNFDEYSKPIPQALSREIEYLQLPPHRNRRALMAEKISQKASVGAVLALFPDIREVDQISIELTRMGITHQRYDSSLNRSERYRAYLQIITGKVSLVIGTRGSIFLPVQGLRNILVFNESSEHYYEQRTPGWSARDIALLRAGLEGVALTFLGYTPSLEVSRLISTGEINFRRSRGKLSVVVASQGFGELLPTRAVTLIRKHLKDGPVLFITPSKGWAHAIRCSRCHTLSKCLCGGALEITREGAAISCNHCGIERPQWSCIWCEHPSYAIIGRGIERHAYEIGALFPKVAIRSSTVESPSNDLIDSGIMIATAAMAPFALNGYSAVIFLEANRLKSQSDFRAQERVREIIFSHSALLRESGSLILIEDEGDPLVTSLRIWNPMPAIEGELQERSDLNLPPFTRTIELSMEQGEVVRLKAALIKAQSEGRLPSELRVLGPVKKGERASIVLSTPLISADAVFEMIHEFLRRRSAAKKPLPNLRIDPYSLSR